MSRTVVIQPFQSEALGVQRYDCFVATIGYETRARYVAQQYGPESRQKAAMGFKERQVLAYPDNKRWFEDHTFCTKEPDDTDFRNLTRDLLNDLVAEDSELARICIDISSLSRFRLAVWIDALRRWGARWPAAVDFVYSAAMFSPPPRRIALNEDLGPVLPSFAGWAEPDQPSSVVVGLGYENNKALGAVEYIDSTEVWAFIPEGHDEKYSREIKRANNRLWDLVPNERRVRYNVFRPFDSFVDLESFAFGALQSRRLILLPFGPKVFALASLLVACIHSEIAVWRVSAGQQDEAIDRVPNGQVIGLRVLFQPGSAPAASAGELCADS